MSLSLKSGLAGMLAAAILAACATPAPGAAQIASASQITPSMEGQTAPDGTVISCRSMQVTGSRFPVKECKSAAAWESFDAAMADNAKSETDKFQRVNTGCSTSGTC